MAHRNAQCRKSREAKREEMATRAIEREQQAFSQHINMFFSDGEGGYDEDLRHLLAIDAAQKEIFTKVKCGLILAKLINATAPGTLNEQRLNKRPKNTWQYSENLNRVVAAAEKIGCKVVNIGGEDIYKGNEVLILGVIWQIIRLQLTKGIALKECKFLYHLLDESESRDTFETQTPEALLLRWFNFHLREAGSERRLRNFGEDLKDGVAFRVLLEQLQPELSGQVQKDATAAEAAAAAARTILARGGNIESVGDDNDGSESSKSMKNARIAIATARRMGVRCFIAAEDICSGNSRLNMAFTAQIFNHCPGLLLTKEQLALLRRPFVSLHQLPMRRAFAKLRQNMLERRIERERFELRWAAALIIQRGARRLLGENRTAVRSASKVQALIRGVQQRARFQKMKQGMIKLQALARGMQQRARFQKMKQGMIKLQALARGMQQRARYQKMKQGMIKLQALARGMQQRARFQKMKQGMIKLQALARGMQQRARFQKMKQGMIKLQALARSMQQRARYQKMKQGMIKLQALARGVQLREQRARYQKMKQGMIKLQALARGMQQRARFQKIKQGMIKLQALTRGMQQRARFQKMKQGMIKLQALARGASTRSRSGPAIRAIRHRLIGANARGKAGGRALTLGGRALSALHALLLLKGNKTVTDMITACKTLELATRLSGKCCVMFANELGAVPLLYSLTRMCNRSVPHLELLTHCLNILRNLCRCKTEEGLVSHVAAPGWKESEQDKANAGAKLGRGSITTMQKLAGEVAADPPRAGPQADSPAAERRGSLQVAGRSDGSSGVPFYASKASTLHVRATAGVSAAAGDEELILGVVKGVSARSGRRQVGVARLDALEVLVDLVQMFREKENTFVLALGMIKRVHEHRVREGQEKEQEHASSSGSGSSSSEAGKASVELRRRLGVTLQLLEKKQRRASTTDIGTSESGRAAVRCARKLRRVLEAMGGGYTRPGLMDVQAELRARAEARLNSAPSGAKLDSTSIKDSRSAAAQRISAHLRKQQERKRVEEHNDAEQEQRRTQAALDKKRLLSELQQKRRSSATRAVSNSDKTRSKLRVANSISGGRRTSALSAGP